MLVREACTEEGGGEVMEACDEAELEAWLSSSEVTAASCLDETRCKSDLTEDLFLLWELVLR